MNITTEGRPSNERNSNGSPRVTSGSVAAGKSLPSGTELEGVLAMAVF
jgi:hypothetical protein